MKRKYRLLFFLIGVVGIVILAINADPTSLDWEEAFRSQFFALFKYQLLVWLVIFGIHAGIYRTILGEDGKRIRFLEMYKICVAGIALNNVTPAGLFGGEPYRIMELKRFVSTEKAASATLTFSLLYALGHALLWFTGAVLYLCFGCPGETFITVLILLFGVICAVFCAYFFMSRGRAVVMPCMKFFARIPLIGRIFRRLLAENEDLYESIDAGMNAFRAQPARFRKAIALEYASRLLEGFEYFLILRFLNVPVSVFGGILVMSLASLLGNILFMIPMQAGTREGGTTIAVLWMGADASAGLMTGLLFRIRELFTTIVGIALILIERKIIRDSGDEC